MITVNSSPNTNQPAYNQLLFNIQSSNSAQPNFKYVVDVYIDGATPTLQSRLLFPLQISGSNLTIDIMPVIKNYVQYDFLNAVGVNIAANTNSRVKYYVQFGEMYDVATVPTIFANLIRNPSSGFKFAYNAVFPFLEFTSNIMASYNVNSDKFLSGDLLGTYRVGDNKLITFYDPARVVTSVQISTDGTAPTTQAITLPASEYEFNLNLKQILTALAITPSGTINVAFKAGGSTVGNYGLIVDTDCTSYEIFRLHWLNKLGGWDAYNFMKSSVETSSINRKQYKKILPLGYSTTDRLKINYQTTMEDNINVTSDWVSDEEFVWLQGLVESPIVYLESGSSFVSVNITDTAYEIKKYINGRKLNTLNINIQPSYNRYSQSL
jgi:hypothetical protein